MFSQAESALGDGAGGRLRREEQEEGCSQLGYNKSVFRNLVMISQVGISVITPVFLCVFIGYQIDSRFRTMWTIPLLILGVLAGGRCAWQLVQRSMKEERRENERLHREQAAKRAALGDSQRPAAPEGVSKPKRPSRIQSPGQREDN